MMALLFFAVQAMLATVCIPPIYKITYPPQSLQKCLHKFWHKTQKLVFGNQYLV